jgi:hypothetical protein
VGFSAKFGTAQMDPLSTAERLSPSSSFPVVFAFKYETTHRRTKSPIKGQWSPVLVQHDIGIETAQPPHVHWSVRLTCRGENAANQKRSGQLTASNTRSPSEPSLMRYTFHAGNDSSRSKCVVVTRQESQDAGFPETTSLSLEPRPLPPWRLGI